MARSRSRSKVRIPIKKAGSLSRFMTAAEKKRGYSKLLCEERRRVLKRALRAGENPLSIFRRLNALAILWKNKSGTLSRKFLSDRNWLRRYL